MFIHIVSNNNEWQLEYWLIAALMHFLSFVLFPFHLSFLSVLFPLPIASQKTNYLSAETTNTRLVFQLCKFVEKILCFIVYFFSWKNTCVHTHTRIYTQIKYILFSHSVFPNVNPYLSHTAENRVRHVLHKHAV